MTQIRENHINFMSTDDRVLRNDLLQKQSKPWNIPMAALQIVELPPQRLLRSDMKVGVKGLIGRKDSQILAQNQHCVTGGIDNVLRQDFVEQKVGQGVSLF